MLFTVAREVTLIKTLYERKGNKKHEHKINHGGRIMFVAVIQRPVLTEGIEYIVLDLPT